MADIRHRIGVAEPVGEVYEAFATREGLTRWWTEKVDGDSSVGGSLGFWFGGDTPSAVMEVVELEPSERVARPWPNDVKTDSWN